MMNKSLSIIFWIVRGVVCLLWSILIIASVTQYLMIPWTPDAPGVGTVLLVALPLVLLFYGALILLIRAEGKSREVIVWGVLIILGLPILTIEYPAPEMTCFRSDLDVPHDIACSYDTLMRYKAGQNTDHPVIVPNDLQELAGTWTNLAGFKEQIESEWAVFDAERHYVKELDEFPGLTDFAEEVPVSADMPLPSFQVLREISRIYSLYAMLQAQTGNTTEGLQHLSQLHSVSMKGLPYSNALVTKMIFCAVSSHNIRTAYHIINNTTCSEEQLLILKRGFPPLSVEHTSMRRVLIAEFLLFQWMAETVRGPQKSEHQTTPFQIMYDYNQTMAEAQAVFTYYLDRAASNEHQLVVNSMSDELLSPRIAPIWLYPKNLAGHMIFDIGLPSYSKAGENLLKTKVYSDLLALEIHRQLGEELHIKDSYTGMDYQYDEQNMRFYSAGPDGIAQNQDDIFIK